MTFFSYHINLQKLIRYTEGQRLLSGCYYTSDNYVKLEVGLIIVELKFQILKQEIEIHFFHSTSLFIKKEKG